MPCAIARRVLALLIRPVPPIKSTFMVDLPFF